MTIIASFLIVNYNGKKYIHQCIDSILKNVTGLSYEIIVVDNLSTDGSRESLAKRNDILYIPSDKNTGFAGGNNLASRHASGIYLILLNNDTLVLSNIKKPIEIISLENVGAVGAKLIYADQKIQHSIGYDHNARRILSNWFLPRFLKFSKKSRLTNHSDDDYSQHWPSVEWVSGAFLVTKKKLWDSLGGLDEKYFMYCEDADYCKNVRDLGLNVAYEPATTILHYEGSGRRWIGERALLNTCDSYLIYTKKHFGIFSLISIKVGLFFAFSLRSSAYLFAKDLEKCIAYMRAALRIVKK